MRYNRELVKKLRLDLLYALAASAAGITYQTFNERIKREKTEKSGKYFQFSQYINKCNVDAVKKLLECLNLAAKAGDTLICM
jgi:hypothetical protein